MIGAATRAKVSILVIANVAGRTVTWRRWGYGPRMLHEFIAANRAELIDRCRRKVALRSAPKATVAEMEHGVPVLIEQLIRMLQVEQTASAEAGDVVGAAAGGQKPAQTEICATAMLHGRELMQRGFTIDQVVHGYGDLCQAVTELACKEHAPIEVAEFRTLNLCLDDAIAGAVSEFVPQRQTSPAEGVPQAVNERLGSFAHELRNHIHTAMLAVTAIKDGKVGMAGATGALLDRSLIGLRNLVDRSLVEVRDAAGLPPRHELISVAAFISDITISASLEAQARQCKLTVSEVDKRLAVDADRDMLFSAVGNLLQNAFKFSALHSTVSLTAYAVGDRILIDIADGCGGLPAGAAERMFLPFTQSGSDRSGHGLGLPISRRAVEANNGTLSVGDVPGSGCIFTIDLPRHMLH